MIIAIIFLFKKYFPGDTRKQTEAKDAMNILKALGRMLLGAVVGHTIWVWSAWPGVSLYIGFAGAVVLAGSVVLRFWRPARGSGPA